MLQTD
jgi:hypothetical protein